jgi:putative Mn2+ efflux pump MntP
MSDVFVSLLPLIVGATVVPVYPIIVLLLLQGEGGLRKASVFVAGAVAIRLVQGVLFGYVIGAAIATSPEEAPRLIASTLLLILGLLLLVAAFRKWRKQEDPDDPPPRWMSAVAGISTFAALGAGALYPTLSVKQWVVTLAAIDVIEASGLGMAASVGLYLAFTLATQVLVLTPIAAFAVAPKRSARPLAAAHAWLERNNRVIMIAVSLIFGLFFLYRGIAGLVDFGAP